MNHAEPYIPVPEDIIPQMVALASVARDDMVFDLGSGDGRMVNAMAPGFFPTKMSRALTDAFEEQIKRAVPLGRIGEEDGLKGVTVFLASEASRYVTGQVIPVDGGYTAW